MSNLIYNPETREALRLHQNKWVPTQVIEDDTGATMAYDGESWKPVSAPAADPANVAPPIDPAGQNLQWDQPGYPQAVPPDTESYSGTILPFSRDAEGNTSFDSNAGIVGPVKRAVTLTREVMEGKIDPTSPEGLRRSLEMAAVISPLSAASRAGAGVMGGPSMMAKQGYKQQQRAVPSRNDLQKAASAGYKKIDKMDVRFDPKAIGDFAAKLEGSLNENGFIAASDGGVKNIHALLQSLKNAPEGSYVKLSALDKLRQRLGDIAGSPDGTARKAAKIAIDAVDDFIASTDPSRLVAGAAPAKGSVAPQGFNYSAADAAANAARAKKASDIILEARGNASAAFRSKKIEELKEVMGLRSSAANSGMNLDNTSRQKLVSLLTSAGGKGVRGFNQAEKDAITKIITGTKSKNAMRRVGNMMGGGGGLGQSLMTFGPAAMVGGSGAGIGPTIAAMAPGATGALAKGLSNRMARKEILSLDDLIRTRSPLYRNTPIPPPTYQPGPTNAIVNTAAKAALARALAQQNGGQMVDGIEYF